MKFYSNSNCRTFNIKLNNDNLKRFAEKFFDFLSYLILNAKLKDLYGNNLESLDKIVYYWKKIYNSDKLSDSDYISDQGILSEFKCSHSDSVSKCSHCDNRKLSEENLVLEEQRKMNASSEKGLRSRRIQLDTNDLEVRPRSSRKRSYTELSDNVSFKSKYSSVDKKHKGSQFSFQEEKSIQELDKNDSLHQFGQKIDEDIPIVTTKKREKESFHEEIEFPENEP